MQILSQLSEIYEVISSLSRTGARSFKGGAVKPANLRLLKK
jgi:hypothetical protein